MPPELAWKSAVAQAFGVDKSLLARRRVWALAITVTLPSTTIPSWALTSRWALASASRNPPPSMARAVTLTLPPTETLPRVAVRNRLAVAEAVRPRFELFAVALTMASWAMLILLPWALKLAIACAHAATSTCTLASTKTESSVTGPAGSICAMALAKTLLALKTFALALTL